MFTLFCLYLSLASTAALPVLTLADALQQAETQSPTLQAAQARLAQAQELCAKAWSAYLPQLSVGGSYIRNSIQAVIELPTTYQAVYNTGANNTVLSPVTIEPSGIIAATIQKQNQLNGQATFSQALIAPAVWLNIHSAYIARDISQLNWQDVRRQTLFSVAQLYYGAASMLETLEAQQEILRVMQKHEQDAVIQYQAGGLSKNALLRAQINRVQTEQDLQQAHNNHEVTKSALAAMLNRDADFDIEPPPAPKMPEPQSCTKDEALKHRPDAQAAALGVALTAAQKTGIALQYVPTLGLTAQYTLANIKGFIGRYDSWSAMLTLNWNILDGGLRHSALREAEAKKHEAKAVWQATQANLQHEIRQAELDYQSAMANTRKATEQVRLARENMDLAQINFAAGAATYLEVDDAAVALIQAERRKIAESLGSQLAMLRLAYAVGEF